MDSDILEILGKDVSSMTEYGPNIHDELSTRLQRIATSGLDKDKGIAQRQKQLALTISCLSEAISSQLLSKNKDSGLLKKLMDATKILCDAQYSDEAPLLCMYSFEERCH